MKCTFSLYYQKRWKLTLSRNLFGHKDLKRNWKSALQRTRWTFLPDKVCHGSVRAVLEQMGKQIHNISKYIPDTHTGIRQYTKRVILLLFWVSRGYCVVYPEVLCVCLLVLSSTENVVIRFVEDFASKTRVSFRYVHSCIPVSFGREWIFVSLACDITFFLTFRASGLLFLQSQVPLEMNERQPECKRMNVLSEEIDSSSDTFFLSLCLTKGENLQDHHHDANWA